MKAHQEDRLPEPIKTVTLVQNKLEDISRVKWQHKAEFENSQMTELKQKFEIKRNNFRNEE